MVEKGTDPMDGNNFGSVDRDREDNDSDDTFNMEMDSLGSDKLDINNSFR